jgi:hypothetical protein
MLGSLQRLQFLCQADKLCDRRVARLSRLRSVASQSSQKENTRSTSQEECTQQGLPPKIPKTKTKSFRDEGRQFIPLGLGISDLNSI